MHPTPEQDLMEHPMVRRAAKEWGEGIIGRSMMRALHNSIKQYGERDAIHVGMESMALVALAAWTEEHFPALHPNPLAIVAVHIQAMRGASEEPND